MRLSRPCYDKPHRCPGWAGGGWKYPKGENRCDNGRIRTRVAVSEFPGEFEYPGTAKWHFGHCTKCDVVTWPWAWRYFDLRWWPGTIPWRVRQFGYRLRKKIHV